VIEEPTDTSLLEELHEDEVKLRRDEKLIQLTLVLIVLLFIVIIAGAYYLVNQAKISKNTAGSVTNITAVSPTSLPTNAMLQTPSPLPTQRGLQETTSEAATKDYYINIGSGINQSADWTDVFGAATTADIGQYTHIKEVHFEAFINVPSANGSVSVRLFNKTDMHPVWGSEITRDGTTDTYQFISPAISYDTGPKLYLVQIKSQLNVSVNLVQSRIHVVAQ